MKTHISKIGLMFLLVFLLFPQFIFAQIDSAIFAGMKARSIGPANMSGRIGVIDAVQSDPDIIYVGTATGGLWKSVDGGLTWDPIFDDQPAASIGAIAINQSNPDVVWVGTGEGAVRNSAGVGRGVYKTMDGGKTWKFLGLEKTERIPNIRLDPNNANVAYVAAMGTAWGENPERGVYKTVDGGKTWKKILYVDEKTGAADLQMDPKNPNKLIAGMWQYRRWPWFFKSGGPGSGMYITVDGGETWKKLTEKEGLPRGELGRIGVAFATNKPEIVYALVEAEKNVLLRSTDGGFNWTVVNNKSEVSNRPFYYQKIWVNPVNENIVYMLHSRMTYSEDGGRDFTNLTGGGQAHADFHAMWLRSDGEELIAGNDGGVVISTNRGENWRFVFNLPLGQFYHVSYDMATPYNVYGGLQDNGSWMGPAYVLKERSLASYLWKTVGGGDGFDVQPDPEVPGAGYGMSQGGSLYYFDSNIGSSRSIRPTESDVKHRYNWNAALAIDPFHPATIYYGSQFVHKSPDKGFTWEIISPDLTTNDTLKQKQAESGGLTLDVTNAENHCTILSISPSPVQEGVIWVGTDDGNVQLTRDGGNNWKLVSKKLTNGKKGNVAPASVVSFIEPSHFDAATAYVTFEDHQRANWTPYVYVTHDYGKSWKSLVTQEIDGYCWVIREDPVKQNLLFLGTEFGLYISFDAGDHWMKWTQGLPTVQVRDLAIHPRENDLIIATHGRSLYIIDDITPLREFSKEILSKKLHLFSVSEATNFQSGRLNSFGSPGDTQFSGQNKRRGACFTYYLIPTKRDESAEEEQAPQQNEMRQRMMERMRQMGFSGRFGGQMGMRGRRSRVVMTIENSEGQTIYRTNVPEEKGLNRAYWNFTEQDPERLRRRGQQSSSSSQVRGGRGRRMGGGLMALPGEYMVKIKYNGQEVSQKFSFKLDPRLDIDLAVLKANREVAKQVQKFSNSFTAVTRKLEQTQKSIDTVTEFVRANRNRENREIARAASDLGKKLKKLTNELNPEPAKQGIADRSAGLRSQVMRGVRGITGAGYYPITQAAKVKYEKVKKQAQEFVKKVNEFYKTDVEAFKKLLKEKGFDLFGTFEEFKLEG